MQMGTVSVKILHSMSYLVLDVREGYRETIKSDHCQCCLLKTIVPIYKVSAQTMTIVPTYISATTRWPLK